MLDLTDYADRWPEQLKPEGWGTDEPEPFDDWWRRNAPLVGHLHPRLAEQWIYRHWKSSPFIGLDLSLLSWRRERWSAEDILRTVFMAYGPLRLDPERDYRTFTRVYPGKRPNPTRLDLDAGSWSFPIIVLETPDGVICEKGRFQNARFVLVEGHNRLHYFNALHHRGEIAGRHDLFILSCR